MANDLTPRSDVFALGIIFHEFFTGTRPKILDEDIKYICEAAVANQIEVSSSIPDDLRNLIISMLEPDYNKRPTLNEVGKSLKSKIVDPHVTDPKFSIVHLKDDLYRVEILNDNPDVEIFYTLDGTPPSSKSLKYTECLELKKYTIVKAICIKGKRKSNIISQSAWVKTQPFTISKAPRIIVHDRNVTILLNEKSPKASTIYYTLDGTLPTTESSLYSEPLNVDKNVEIVQAMVVEPGPRVRQSETVSAKVYKIKRVDPPEIKKTLFKNAFSIMSSEKYDIYYTLDGCDPSDKSLKYAGEFSVDDIETFHIKAVCIFEGVKSEIVELKKSKSGAKMKFKTK